MSKTKELPIVSLESPVTVQFTIKMETEKAIIAENITLQGADYIQSTNLPKMYTNIVNVEDGIVTAHVEEWVLEQRAKELYNPDRNDVAKKLLALKYSEQEVDAMPWD